MEFVIRRNGVRITKKSGSYYEENEFVLRTTFRDDVRDGSWWCSWSKRKLFVITNKKFVITNIITNRHERHHEPSRMVTNCHEHITNHHEYYVSFFFVMCSWCVRDEFVTCSWWFVMIFVIVRITFVLRSYYVRDSSYHVRDHEPSRIYGGTVPILPATEKVLPSVAKK